MNLPKTWTNTTYHNDSGESYTLEKGDHLFKLWISDEEDYTYSIFKYEFHEVTDVRVVEVLLETNDVLEVYEMVKGL